MITSSPYKSFQCDWLITPDDDAVFISPQPGETEWMPFPIPPEMGEGRFQSIELAIGMSIFHSEHHFNPAALGQLFPLAKIEMDFHEQTFLTQVVRGGPFIHREIYPQGEFLLSTGRDLFRMTDRVELSSILDGSYDAVSTSLIVGWATLCQLLGNRTAETLQANLGLTDWPRVTLKQIPLHVSSHLQNALPRHLQGAARLLHCQARILDYFEALIQFFQLKKPVVTHASDKEIIRALHQFLIQSEGKLPKLDELSTQFGRSARALNEGFLAEYGMTIYGFITTHRLNEAHEAILSSNVPLKQLSARLGYAHFNHFSAAFKKRFGYPPGSLRKHN